MRFMFQVSDLFVVFLFYVDMSSLRGCHVLNCPFAVMQSVICHYCDLNMVVWNVYLRWSTQKQVEWRIHHSCDGSRNVGFFSHFIKKRLYATLWLHIFVFNWRLIYAPFLSVRPKTYLHHYPWYLLASFQLVFTQYFLLRWQTVINKHGDCREGYLI